MTREEMKVPWSIQDTTENLKELKVILQKQLKRKNYEGQGERDSKEIGIDFDMAIEALEKQIPKKVKNIKHRPNGLYGFCSVCNHALLKESYCPRCGNALDWTEPYKEGET